LGQRYGVDGTPFFFINGRPMSGVRSLVELQQAVQIAMGDNNPAATVVAAASTRHFIADNPSANGTPVNIDWYIDLEAAASPAIGPIVHGLSARPGVRIAIHSFALPSHPNAALAYRALMIASSENKFWPLYDALAGKPLPSDEAAARAAIQAAATSLHLDGSRIAAAFDDAKLTEDLETDQQEAFRRGVRGVPVVFVNNQRVDGIQPEAVYDRYIDQANPKTVAIAAKP
jgi:protein-disulfide isomerase